jgi:hypothetical protein
MTDNKNDDGDNEHKLTNAESAIIQLMKQKATPGTAFKDDMKEHALCDTQPIPHAGAALPEGAIVPNKPTDEPRTAPYNMPTGFEWSDVDIS